MKKLKNQKTQVVLAICLLGIITWVALAGGAGSAKPVKTANSFTLEAKAYYRASDTRPLSPAKVLRTKVTIPKGTVNEIARKSIVAVAKFPDLSLRLENHHNGSIIADVIDNHTGKQISRRLWQFTKSPGNTFGETGQGFTGLIYVYHPVTGAEMQIICFQAK